MTSRLTLALLLAAGAARAEAPSVLTDTPPVHSLVAMVMGDLGAPALITAPGTSPHAASLTPGEAAALGEADLVVWTGPAFLPWVEEAVATLAPQAEVLSLLGTAGWLPLPAREASPSEGGAAPIDPHAWLDPAVAAAWLGPVAEALAAADPDNAAAYRANAALAARRVTALGRDLRARIGPLAGSGLAVGHDAYQYLERAAGLPAGRTLGSADGARPSPGDVAAVRDAVASGEVGCLLLDSETDPGLAATLGEGTPLRVATVDPEGVSFEPGPGLYPAMIEALAAALEGCLAP